VSPVSEDDEAASPDVVAPLAVLVVGVEPAPLASVVWEAAKALAWDGGDLAASAVSELPHASTGSSFFESSAVDGSTAGLAGPHAAMKRIELRIRPLMTLFLPCDARRVDRRRKVSPEMGRASPPLAMTQSRLKLIP
jgi:hypothetical protein